MTAREAVGKFKEIYGANVSPSLISKVNNAVLLEQVDPLARTIGILILYIVLCICRFHNLHEVSE